MQLRELIGRPVFDIEQAKEVSSIRTGVIDPRGQRIVGFRVGGDQPILALDELKAIGADTVTVAGPDRLRQPSTDVEQRAVDHDLDPLGARALADDGTLLGEVSDVDFDPDTGRISAVVVESQRVGGDRICGLGGYALVVRAER